MNPMFENRTEATQLHRPFLLRKREPPLAGFSRRDQRHPDSWAKIHVSVSSAYTPKQSETESNTYFVGGAIGCRLLRVGGRHFHSSPRSDVVLLAHRDYSCWVSASSSDILKFACALTRNLDSNGIRDTSYIRTTRFPLRTCDWDNRR
jgi:hypothetical protein